MKISVSELKGERQWRSATGLGREKFYELLAEYEKSYREIYGVRLSDRQADTTISYCIKTEAELLLFTLLSLKSGLTYDLLGLFCGMNGSNAKRNQTAGLKVLERTVEKMGHMPKRHIESIEELEACFRNTEELLIDATEQRIQRFSLPEAQKAFFSGKKMPHCEIHDNQ